MTNTNDTSLAGGVFPGHGTRRRKGGEGRGRRIALIMMGDFNCRNHFPTSEPDKRTEVTCGRAHKRMIKTDTKHNGTTPPRRPSRDSSSFKSIYICFLCFIEFHFGQLRCPWIVRAIIFMRDMRAHHNRTLSRPFAAAQNAIDASATAWNCRPLQLYRNCNRHQTARHPRDKVMCRINFIFFRP